ncbi:hypothetical protein CRYUN_Cryun24cG0111600 [Craigia yunnanensis]
MNRNSCGEDADNFDWDTEDELEIDNYAISSRSGVSLPNGETDLGSAEVSSSADSLNSKLIDHFVGMGFPKELVAKAIKENGKASRRGKYRFHIGDSIDALEKSAPMQQPADSGNWSSDYEGSFLDDFSDIDSSSETEEIMNPDSDEERKLLYLTKMGYSEAEASIAMERYGPDSSIAVFICAAQMAKAADALFPP